MPSAARDQLFGLDKQILRFAQNDDTAKPSGFVRRSKRVASINREGETGTEIVLCELREARQDKSRRIRVRGKVDRQFLVRRVCLDPIGKEIGSEPGEPA